MAGELQFAEVADQLYAGNGARFSAGFVAGHPVDNMYFRLERPGEDDVVILLRPDEVAIIANLLTGVLWSWMVSAVQDGQPLAICAPAGR